MITVLHLLRLVRQDKLLFQQQNMDTFNKMLV